MRGASILVRGPALRVAVVGAYLARRLLGAGNASLRRLVLSPDGMGDAATGITARPDHLRFHAELGVPHEAVINKANARPLLAPSYPSASGAFRLPYLPIGPSLGGVEFHHYWHRANRIEKQPDLLGFSQSLALQEAGEGPSWAHLPKGASGYGLTLASEGYVPLLLGLVSQLGGEIAPSGQEPKGGEPEGGDLVFDCSGIAKPCWSGSGITIREPGPLPGPLPGMEWQIAVDAARRFVGLSSSSAHSTSEQREYTRLAQAEAQRIADMEELLAAPDPHSCTSPTLRRKVELFEACGRIPTEDFEVFSPPEWLAALWHKGVRPRRYDRLADRMPEAELMVMITQHKSEAEALGAMKEVA